MKTKFTTVDIRASVLEVKRRWIGMRVTNVYDIDNKTYLVKLAKPDQKALLVLESGSRFHSTEFDWPKNNSPSGFSMKLRKHLRGRRLESVQQLGADRVVDMQFGSNEAAYHIVLELYDRGNLVLTDHQYNILNLLRVRTDESQDVKLAVQEVYPLESARPDTVDLDRLHSALLEAKEGDHLKRVLNLMLPYGPALIEHSFRTAGLPENARIGKEFVVHDHMAGLLAALAEAQRILESMGSENSKGYIIQKKEKKASSTEGELITYNEFHPYLYKQHESCPFLEFESFSKAVDEFFSKIESQKLDMKTLQQEKSVLRKLENVRKDHAQRLQALANEQEKDNIKGQLIEMNLPLVERAILVVQSALANQLDWADINQLVQEAKAQGDPVASSISSLQLQSNHFSMMLRDCYEGDEEDMLPAQKVQIDLGLSAYANARKYYDKKKHAAQKEQKTVAASTKALKSAEKKTKQTLKAVQVAATIRKQRKTHWFEKFLWFISSENYLVIGGGDQQQNELIVKRHLRPGDIYVHADLHGASSVIIKNPGGEIPPKTLNEAGTMALCHSAAWDAKVVTSAWWVFHHQVSKTAPTGEYLTTGSFMVRGKKNFLPPSYLIYGFGFLFKVDDTSIFRHQDERKVRSLEQEEEQPQVEEIGGGEEEEEEESEDESVKEDVEEKVLEEVKEEVEEEKEEEEVSFPNTHIELQHIQGGKFALQSSAAAASAEDGEEDVVYLGDDRPLSLKPEDNQPSKGAARLSAKQRRQMKKARQQGDRGEDEEEVVEEVKAVLKIEEPPPTATKEEEKQPQPIVPLKRGQKAKLKKIREKYADQDDEERQLRMEILQGSQERKTKKGRKGKQQEKQLLKESKQQQQLLKESQKAKPHRKAPLTAADIIVETPEYPSEALAKKVTEDDGGNSSGEEERQALEADDVRLVPDADILAALTGLPDPEDTLLCSIPVCAPYSTLSKYKFKVKLIPGSTKRGKVCKVALNMFHTDRNTTLRERELLKSLKEEDMARNIPGKCKVSAPNLHKNKGK